MSSRTEGDFAYINCTGHCGAIDSMVGVHQLIEHPVSLTNMGNESTYFDRGPSGVAYWHQDECCLFFESERL